METQPTAAPSPLPEAVPPVGISDTPAKREKKPIRWNKLRWWVCGCAGVPLVLLLLLALIVFIDPFKLHLWGRMDGSFDAAAEVMPANTGMYLGFNIGNALLTRVDRVLAPFTPNEQSGSSSSGINFLHAHLDRVKPQLAGPFDDMLTEIEAQTGITIPDDLTPWVGQYGGIGTVKLQQQSNGTQFPVGWIIALEARNITRADAFLETLQGNLADLQNMTFSRQSYNGTQLFVQEVKGLSSALSFGRSGRMLLMASDLNILKDAINQQEVHGFSLQENYHQLIELRPRNWSASLYLSRDAYGSLIEELGTVWVMAGSMSLVDPSLGTNWTGILLTASVIQNGLRFDGFTSYDMSSHYAAENELLQNRYIPSSEIIQVLPQDTLVYLTNSRFDLFFQNIISPVLLGESDPTYLFDSFEQAYGFSLHNDLLAHLNGQWALYVVPSTSGLLPDQANLNLAISLLAQTDATIDLKTISDKLNSFSDYGGIRVNSQQRDGATYYGLSSFENENSVLAFGQANGYFTLGTDIDSIQVPSSNNATLINYSGYKEAKNALPSGMQPSIYIDFERLFANIREGMEVSERESFNSSISSITPIRIIASANRLLQPGIAQTSIIVIISYK
jgi:hypothetical protein